ncbi:MAG: cbb3-type cytochrome c oxidase subunit I [Ilumatobacteraceae bacterium]
MTTIESSSDAVAAPSSSDTAHASTMLGWLAGIFTSTDHKVTGRLYLAGGLIGLLATAVINVLIGIERLDGADVALDIEVLPQLIDAQHVGLVFAALLPLAMAACVAFVPLQLGARSIAFPRLASAGFWMWLGGAILTFVSLLANGGTAGSDSDMVDLFIAGLGLMAIGLTATSGAVATSILTTRAPGMTMRRVPPFTWSALVYSLGVILVMPVFLGTLTYLFLDHRNARTGFGGNVGIIEWVGWMMTQPTTFLFAIPAIGLLAELVPVTFGKRTPARGVLFGGIALVGVAALAGTTQQSVQSLPWSGSQLSTDDLETKVKDLVPFLLFNALPLLGVTIVVLVLLAMARPQRGMKLNVTPALLFSFFGFAMVLVGMVGNLLYSVEDLGLQGTVFAEATLVYVVYGAALAAMGAIVHWAPKLWGSKLGGVKSIPLALLGVTGTILAAFPLYIAGFLDQESGPFYSDDDLAIWNILSLVGHGIMALTVLAFIGLALTSFKRDDSVGDDPWDAQTIEWTTTSPAPRDNFVDVPVVHSAEPLLDLKMNLSASNDGSDA